MSYMDQPLGIGLRLAPSEGVGVCTVEQLLAALAADGQQLDAIYEFDADGALTDHSGNGRTLTETETITFLEGLGFEADGVSGKLVGIGNPSALTYGLQDDASISLVLTKMGNGRHQIFRDGGSGQFGADLVQTTPGVRIHAAASATFTCDNAVGAFTFWRDPADVGNVHMLKGDGTKQTKASTSAARQSAPLAIFKNNTAFSSDTLLIVMVGAGGTEAQMRRRNRWMTELSVALGWSKPPAPQYVTLSPIGFTTHPDGPGSAADKGIVCTGLCPDGSGGLWAADDGRSDEADTSSQPLIRHYPDPDDLDTFTDFLLSADALGTHFSGLGITVSNLSPQGLAIRGDTSQVQFVVVDRVTPANTRVVSMNTDGTNVSSWVPSGFTSVANGLAYLDGCSLVLGAQVYFRSPTDGAASALSGGINSLRPNNTTGLDHLTVSPDGEWIGVTSGDNGVPGTLEIWSVVNEWNAPVLAKVVTLDGVLAVEGAALIGSVLYVNSDPGFHPTGVPEEDQTNRLVRFDATGLFAW